MALKIQQLYIIYIPGDIHVEAEKWQRLVDGWENLVRRHSELLAAEFQCGRLPDILMCGVQLCRNFTALRTGRYGSVDVSLWKLIDIRYNPGNKTQKMYSPIFWAFFILCSKEQFWWLNRLVQTLLAIVSLYTVIRIFYKICIFCISAFY